MDLSEQSQPNRLPYLDHFLSVVFGSQIRIGFRIALRKPFRTADQRLDLRMFTRSGRLFIPSPNKFARKLINCQLVWCSFYSDLTFAVFARFVCINGTVNCMPFQKAINWETVFCCHSARRYEPSSFFFLPSCSSFSATEKCHSVCGFSTKRRRNRLNWRIFCNISTCLHQHK